MTTPVTTQITAAGAANRVILPIVTIDTQTFVLVSGAYAGLQLVFQGAFDYAPGVATWVNVPVIRQDNLNYDTNTVLLSDGLTNAIVVGDSTNRLWVIPNTAGFNAVSVYAAALTSGPVNVQMRSGTFFAGSPSAMAQSLGGLTLTQLLMQNNMLLAWLKEPSGGHPPSGLAADFTAGQQKLVY